MRESRHKKTDEEIRERIVKWEAELKRECAEPRPDREIKLGNVAYPDKLSGNRYSSLSSVVVDAGSPQR